MTSPLAVVNLNWDGHDLARPDLDVFFDLAEGLDTLPETRGEDQLIPFRAGRLPSSRLPHRRPIVANGHIAGTAGASARASFRAYVDEVKGWMDPTLGERILVATLEDGSTRWITCAARNLLPGDGWAGEFRAMSLEWEAVSDPLWHGSWGTLILDAGYALDAGWTLDQSRELVVVPPGSVHVFEVDVPGTTYVTLIQATFVAPSVGDVGLVNETRSESVGFTAVTLGSGDPLVINNEARTVLRAMASLRQFLTLEAGNQHGEYLRLYPGVNRLRVTGQPAELRLVFTPTYL